MDRTKGLQARFMLHRLNSSFPRILKYARARGQGEIVESNYKRLLYRKDGTIDPQGAYILIDYINFKGDGINKGERYQGKGWGLYQVLTRRSPRSQSLPCLCQVRQMGTRSSHPYLSAGAQPQTLQKGLVQPYGELSQIAASTSF